ncbi:MAG TPA: gliding motility-associated C-terminal domain-containing protein [Saprospiraceae bacterium]
MQTLKAILPLLFRHVCFLVLIVLAPVLPKAQTIYLVSSDGIWRLNLETCIKELIVELDISNTSDIAFHPDGTLYGLDPNGEIFTIDTLTGITSFIIDLPGSQFQAMTCSKAGILYITGRYGELWTFDPINGVATLLGSIGFEYGGDLTFFGGNLYMTSYYYDLIILVDLNNLANSKVVMTEAGGLGGGMYGIVTDARDCNNVRFYGIISGNFLVSEVDINAMTSDTVCILDRLMAGATTSHEFKASDPIRITDTVIIHPDCGLLNGSISLTTLGGTPPYQYSLNGDPFQSANIFGNLTDGQYTVEVVDSRNCMTSIDVLLVPQDVDIIDSFEVTDETCEQQNGTIHVILNNTGPFQYSIDGILFQDSPLFIGLDQGVYEISVMNEAGCIEQMTTEVIAVPPVIISNMLTVPTTCGDSNGSLTIETQNGNQITYSIDDISFQQSNLFTQLGGGHYDVYVMDENGCVDVQLAVIADSEPLLVDSTVVEDPSCGQLDGKITLYISNETGLLSYTLNQQTTQTLPVFTALEPGTYTWSAIDEKGCTAEGTATLNAKTTFQIESIVNLNADCSKSNGSLKISIANQTSPIAITLNGIPYVQSESIDNLAAGIYQVILTDEQGCSTDTTVTILQNQCSLFIPNVFSPNGDGINDLLLLSGSPDLNMYIHQLLIFDRWGNMVHAIHDETVTGPFILWDGTSREKQVAGGVYTYTLTVNEGGGSSAHYKGDITLIR